MSLPALLEQRLRLPVVAAPMFLISIRNWSWPAAATA